MTPLPPTATMSFALSMLQYVEYYEQWHVRVLLPRRFILEMYENA